MNKDIIKQAGFEKEALLVEQGICPICKKEIKPDDFKDSISLKEYGISGLCQKCQDITFGT